MPLLRACFCWCLTLSAGLGFSEAVDAAEPFEAFLEKRTGEETVEGLIAFDLTAPEDNPQVYEFEVFLEMPISLEFCVVATEQVHHRPGEFVRLVLPVAIPEAR